MFCVMASQLTLPFARMPEFYLGMSQFEWLRNESLRDVNVFLSMRRLYERKNLPRDNLANIAFDSGAFKQLQMFGKWDLSADQFADRCLELQRHFGRRALWFSPQDWMCEKIVINGGKTKDGVFVGTGLTVEEHQLRTVKNYIQLRNILGDAVIPVVQGDTVFDYWRCLQMYRDHGVALEQCERVGVGSVCRRQSSNDATLIMQSIAHEIGPRLHGYGFKINGYKTCAGYMISGDSFSWSITGRLRPDETHEHYLRSVRFVPENKGKRGCADDCSQCLPFALAWRAALLKTIEAAVN